MQQQANQTMVPAEQTSEQISVAALNDVAETLLIPLVARAEAQRLNPDLGFADPTARTIMDRLEADPDRFAGDKASMRGGVLRAQWFDRVTTDFLARHPDGLCVSLGAGLDTRAQRVGFPGREDAAWTDVDCEAVVALRRTLIGAQPRVSQVAADLNETGWIESLSWPEARPALFMAEGVMMYLTPGGAEGLIEALGAAAEKRGAALVLAFDYASPLMVRHSRRHPSVKKTRARFAWALRRPRDLQRIDPALVCTEQADISAGCGFVSAAMSKLHRWLTLGRMIYACARFERQPAREGRPAA